MSFGVGISGSGVVSQSGGLGTDIVRRGLNRGVKFSGLVTVGNCADIGPSDMLEYYFADPDTKVIGMYIETARDARRIFEILRAEKARKPVVLLKGGRTKLGLAAAVSLVAVTRASATSTTGILNAKMGANQAFGVQPLQHPKARGVRQPRHADHFGNAHAPPPPRRAGATCFSTSSTGSRSSRRCTVM